MNTFLFFIISKHIRILIFAATWIHGPKRFCSRCTARRRRKARRTNSSDWPSSASKNCWRALPKGRWFRCSHDRIKTIGYPVPWPWRYVQFCAHIFQRPRGPFCRAASIFNFSRTFSVRTYFRAPVSAPNVCGVEFANVDARKRSTSGPPRPSTSNWG